MCVNKIMAQNAQNIETKRPHRGKNFSASDDRNICIAWLAISNDTLKGRDQQGDAFWKEVQEHAKVKKRNWNGIRQRWGQISRCVTKFIECYTVIHNRTGGTLQEDSVYDEAVKLYLATTNKRWQFAECWEMLRNSPKFNHIHEMRTTTATAGLSTFIAQPLSFTDVENESNEGGGITYFGDFNSTSEISIACKAENGFQQPNDWEKSNCFQSSPDLERRRVEALEMMAKVAERKNELLVEHIKALQAATDAKIITTPVDNLDALSLQILELKKIKILMELQNVDTKE